MNEFLKKEKEGNSKGFRRRRESRSKVTDKNEAENTGCRKDISNRITGVDYSRFGDFTVWTDINGNFHVKHNK